MAPANSHADTDFLRAFCEGAGLNPAIAGGPQSEALAHELGRLVRIAAQELMRMLQDRANVKQFTRGGERTMRSATGNNPLKFLPDPDQALEALFINPRDGFMTGADGFENALKDLRRHQMAVFAALQPALAEVLTGLSPMRSRPMPKAAPRSWAARNAGATGICSSNAGTTRPRLGITGCWMCFCAPLPPPMPRQPRAAATATRSDSSHDVKGPEDED